MSYPTADRTWTVFSRVANQDVKSGAWGNDSGWNAFMQGGLLREQEQEQSADIGPEGDGMYHGNAGKVTEEVPKDSQSERPSL